MTTKTEASPSIGETLASAARRLAASGSPSPTLDAELLLADALGMSRAALVARRPEALPARAAAEFEARVARREAHEPVAYIVGRREFYDLSFEVTPAVLVPRPETELLVDAAREFLAERAAAGSPGARVADVGTGSGCLAVTLAVHAPDARIVATDLSAAALVVARRNARRYAVESQVRLVRADLLDPVASPLDLVVANLPYVSSAEVDALAPDVRLHEPRLALDGGPDGAALIERLVGQAVSRLAGGGCLLLEVAAGQAGRVAGLLRATGAFSDVSMRRDLAGIERMVGGRTWTRS